MRTHSKLKNQIKDLEDQQKEILEQLEAKKEVRTLVYKLSVKDTLTNLLPHFIGFSIIVPCYFWFTRYIASLTEDPVLRIIGLLASIPVLMEFSRKFIPPLQTSFYVEERKYGGEEDSN